MNKSYFKFISFAAVFYIFNSAFLIQNCFCQWVQVSNGIGNKTVSSLVVSGNNIFAGVEGSGQGVYLSTNNGSNWSQIWNTQNIVSLAVNGNYLFAGTFSNAYSTTNSGANWALIPMGGYSVNTFAVNGNYMYAGVFGIYYSLDSGVTWSYNTSTNHTVYSFLTSGNNVFAGTLSDQFNPNGGVFLSTNNGLNWAPTTLLNKTVRALAKVGNVVFAGTVSNGIYLTTDNGASWSLSGLNGNPIYSFAVYGNYIFAGSLNNVYLSYDNGTSWIPQSEGLNNVGLIFSLLILNNYIFAGTTLSGVYSRPLDELTGFQPSSNEVPKNFSLFQNYPNPFNPSTKIKFAIPAGGQRHAFDVQLKIYNILGELVTTLVNEQLNPGAYEVDFDASNFSSGVYYYKIVVGDNTNNGVPGDYTETKKMVLIK